MADKKIIAVLGSTGSQGGGLCRAILADSAGGFACRAVTRDTSKDKAKALAVAGAQVVKADLDDVESLKKAFAGAYGVYAVTNFWEHFSGEKEKAQAKNIADAAKAAGVKHVIWSTLEDIRKFMKPDDKRMPMLQQKYRVPHFDAKAEANAFFAGVPTTFLVTSFYWDNLYMFGLAPKKGRTASSRGRSRWAPRRWRASRPTTSARSRTASSRAARSTSARPSASTARRSRSIRWARRSARCSAWARSSTTRSRPTSIAASDSRVRTRWATCSRHTATSRRKCSRRAASDTARKLNPALQTFEQFVKNKKDAILPAMG